jgi:SARP family transcriptional regulator, regulator of embCAB operon
LAAIKFPLIAADHDGEVLPVRRNVVSPPFTPDSGTASRGTRIQLTGRLKVDIDGRHVTPDLRGRQGRIALAYLILHRNRPVSREELIAAIWPLDQPADPAAALRTQLSHLRKALGPDSLVGRATIELRLPEGTWVDIEAAHRALEVAGLAVADEDWDDAWIQSQITLNIAGRPFLAGFDATWADEIRRDLADLDLRALELVSRAGVGLGGSELPAAERAARTLIQEAPLRESGYVCLMEALQAEGHTAEALEVYDTLRQLLQERLGTAPGANAQALHRRLLA